MGVTDLTGQTSLNASSLSALKVFFVDALANLLNP